MSESKQLDGDDFLSSRPVVNVTAVDISPNPAALTDELNLEVDFRLDAAVSNGVWDIEVRDPIDLRLVGAAGRKERQLRRQLTALYLLGFAAAAAVSAGIQPSQLTNCGLLVAAFKDGDGDILDLKMVIQVSEQRGGLQRIIYSPLE
ncbi:hypothetical protein BBJ28_00010106 [Nothophytophthora sp. Chile5]|nr:hypothetical protein BBJ28_00010106 [Nothophytophthora sp. Chile5]